MRLLIAFILVISGISISQAQSKSAPMEKLPYYEIPEAPADFSGASVLARNIDGLGFRYHWASEGLRTIDLEYYPGFENQGTMDVLVHIHDLSQTILKVFKKEAITRSQETADLSYEQIRRETLNNLKQASDILRKGGDDVSQYKVIFQRGESTVDYPIWNLINGQLADAMYHTGQIVSYRRSSGNSIRSDISLFQGKVRDRQ